MNLILSGAGMTPLEFKKNKKIDGIPVDFFLNYNKEFLSIGSHKKEIINN